MELSFFLLIVCAALLAPVLISLGRIAVTRTSIRLPRPRQAQKGGRPPLQALLTTYHRLPYG